MAAQEEKVVGEKYDRHRVKVISSNPRAEWAASEGVVSAMIPLLLV
jgi:hypothetical protein